MGYPHEICSIGRLKIDNSKSGLISEKKIADLRKVFACTVTNISENSDNSKDKGGSLPLANKYCENSLNLTMDYRAQGSGEETRVGVQAKRVNAQRANVRPAG